MPEFTNFFSRNLPERWMKCLVSWRGDENVPELPDVETQWAQLKGRRFEKNYGHGKYFFHAEATAGFGSISPRTTAFLRLPV